MIVLPPTTRVKGVGRQQQPYGGNELEHGSYYGFVCCEDRFLLFPPCCWCECHEYPYFPAHRCDLHVFVACEPGVESQSQQLWVYVHGECDAVHLPVKLCAVFRRAWCEESECCLVWVENEVVCLSTCMYPM